MEDNEKPKCTQCNNEAPDEDRLCQSCSDKWDLVCELNCGGEVVEMKVVSCLEETTMERAEFLERYSKKIIVLTCVNTQVAEEMAENEWEDWDGIDTPEECAESEVSYWGD